ncbi:site-2 protease family protein [Paenibacillus sp. OV219]|uniref:site-2 protease family protein n=1 Tax=Paenibacillus sp. OV219 TaxID=1884377 RepID=UPI0008ABECA7|nr:site-2 protease family protein [Paenibacillus sp. OV219]SEN08442.1 Zn-dependent protease (includes SpoIVFB) [Paenibacillus sp. OV219]
MSDLLWYPLNDLPFVFLVIMIAFTAHEFAHAYFAYLFGDRTAYDAGRVTLNPRVHLDMMGTILILIAGFGWARPVPVNRGRFKHPRLMGIVVSAVGPLSNLLLSAIGILAVYVLNETGLLDAGSIGVHRAIVHFLHYLITLNIVLFIFNLIPVPPLDGYRIIQDVVPTSLRIRMDQNAHWGIFIFLLIVFIPPLRAATLDPLFMYSNHIISGLIDFFDLFFKQVDWQQFDNDFLR